MCPVRCNLDVFSSWELVIFALNLDFSLVFMQFYISLNANINFFLPCIDVPASGMYFLTYEYIKDWAAKEFGSEGSRALLGTIFAGGMAGIANWTVGMPADVLKSRLQTG